MRLGRLFPLNAVTLRVGATFLNKHEIRIEWFKAERKRLHLTLV